MAKATYLVTADFKTPYVTSTPDPRNPTKINWKVFRKGDLLSGELKHSNNKPAFVLYNGVAVIPLSVIKAVVTKEIVSNAGGPENTAPLGSETTKKIVEVKSPKVRYADAAIFGALVGMAGVFLANKKGWIKVPDNMNYAYGAGIGAAAGAYIIYRNSNKPKLKTTT